jgi:hypothetical protein
MTTRRIAVGSAVVLIWLCAGIAVPPAAAQARIAAEAVVGEPLGVGRLIVDLPAAMLPEALGVEGLGISEKNGRVLYPALHNPALGALMNQILGVATPLTTGGPVRQEVAGILRDLFNRPPRTTIYFLFRGDAPLEISVEARQSIPVVVRPRRSPALHQSILQSWLQQYAAPRRLLQQKPDFPPLVENYLTTTLAQRLNLRLPEDKQTESAYSQFEHEASVLVGTESIQIALEQDRLLGALNFDQPADRPLPPAVAQPPLEVPEGPKDVKIEPIALRVPAECFYVRFGNFANFLWMQDTLEQWGGDLQNLVAMRGLDYGRNQRMQDQLVLRQTELSRLLGGTVISDVAIIGTDMLFRDGAAYGFLFEARNNTLLAADMEGQRKDRIKKGGVKEQKVNLDGQEVSYLSAPDGSVRSYYAASNGYHFITSSQTLMARFLQTAKGAGSLGASSEFRHVRTLVPANRGDAVFLYMSDAFFQNITSPYYRTEMIRRLESVADIELVTLAKLNAATEAMPGGTIEELVGDGLLPRGFGRRPDGSEAVLAGGDVHDSRRGWRGNFVPVPDVPVQGVTPREEDSYRRFAEFCRTTWGRLEPVILAVQRTALPDRKERVVLDVRMTPLCRQRIEFLQQWAGAADKNRLVPVPGNLAALEAVLRTQRVFAGLCDVIPPTEIFDGRAFPWARLRDTLIGYLGTVGDIGVLAPIDLLIPQPPDPNGYSRNILGLWRRRFGSFTVYSFQPDVLAAVTPQLRFEEAQRPAQLRVHIGDVTQARMTPFLNNLGYARTRETALGNVRLMHQLNQQLHVPPKDCKEAVEFLLAAKLICPLGGKYVLKEAPNSVARWTSTELERGVPQGQLVPQAPAGYVAPPLNWFRGLDADATLVEKVLSAHAEVVMQLPPKK